MGKGSSPVPEKKAAENTISKTELSGFYKADNYVCQLPSDIAKVAKKELREDETRRTQALEQIRDWISKTSYITNCRLDSNFLLRFLRNKKFSVPLAQEAILRYIILRQEFQGWFYNTYMYDPPVLDLINRGVAFALPKRDKFGRRVLFTVGGNIDPYVHTPQDVMKSLMVVFESMLEDEVNQVLGFCYVLDEGGITMAHITNLWNPSEVSKIFMSCEKSMPLRHKQIELVRLPHILNYVLEFAKTFMSSKFKSRMNLHKDASGLKEVLDPKILPKEYGGTMPMQEMIELFKKEVHDKQARIQALDEMKVDIELMKAQDGDTCYGGKNNSILPNEIFGVKGSFKRLEID